MEVSPINPSGGFPRLFAWLLRLAIVPALLLGLPSAATASGVDALGECSELQRVVPLDDGSAFAVGGSGPCEPFSSERTTVVVRLDSSGRLDPSFAGGIVAGRHGGVWEARATTGGTFTLVAGTSIVRYLGDGTLDPGFGDSGVVDIDFGADASVTRRGVQSAAITPDGTVYVYGWTWDQETEPLREQVISRYLPDGSLDEGFGSDGRAAGATAASEKLALDGSGRIYSASQGADYLAGEATRLAVLVTRYQADGELDLSYGQAGSGSAILPHPLNPFLSGDIGAFSVDEPGRARVAAAVVTCYRCDYTGYSGELDPDGSQAGPSVVFDFVPAALSPTGRVAARGVPTVWVPTISDFDYAVLDGSELVGRTSVAIGPGNSLAWGAAFGPGGSVYAVGQAAREVECETHCGSAMVITRSSEDGRLDQGWGENGVTVLPGIECRDGETAAFDSPGTTTVDRCRLMLSRFGSAARIGYGASLRPAARVAMRLPRQPGSATGPKSPSSLPVSGSACRRP